MTWTNSLAAILIAGLLAPRGEMSLSPLEAPSQPVYRVVMTPPFRSTGWDRKKPYEDYEQLTMALNVLDAEGYEPVFLEPIIDDRREAKGEYRFVITAKRR